MAIHFLTVETYRNGLPYESPERKQLPYLWWAKQPIRVIAEVEIGYTSEEGNGLSLRAVQPYERVGLQQATHHSDGY